MVCLVCLVCLVFWLNETNQINKTNQINQTNQLDPSVLALRANRNRLKNHTPQGKLPPQPITTTTHPPQPYPGVRRVLPSGEVREWPNRAVSKTAVLATGPWVRSPPSPPN